MPAAFVGPITPGLRLCVAEAFEKVRPISFLRQEAPMNALLPSAAGSRRSLMHAFDTQAQLSHTTLKNGHLMNRCAAGLVLALPIR